MFKEILIISLKVTIEFLMVSLVQDSKTKL